MTKEQLTALINKVLGECCPEHDEGCMTCAAWWMLREIDRLRNDIQELTCGDIRRVFAARPLVTALSYVIVDPGVPARIRAVAELALGGDFPREGPHCPTCACGVHEPTGYAKCLHSMADAIGVAEERWSIDGWCAACAWHAAHQNREAKP